MMPDMNHKVTALVITVTALLGALRNVVYQCLESFQTLSAQGQPHRSSPLLSIPLGK